ncbi:hypothetical protein BGX23_001054 [Mortierella sp. AD031]|nr:hypothetical protein BGX23_001054 [Mortierella sp. AD031]KAG0208664.1 hypothetical protein BGX33_006110 [Mortierella sp. NVP41]
METGTPENITKDILSLSVKDYEALLEWVHKVTIIPAGLDTRAKENMLAYRIYDAIDPLLVLERQRGNDITALYNNATTSIAKVAESNPRFKWTMATT